VGEPTVGDGGGMWKRCLESKRHCNGGEPLINPWKPWALNA
jgi:hypothetical protein